MSYYNVIDTDDLGASGFETLFFPGGEPYVKCADRWPDKSVHVWAKVRTWNDAGILASLLNLLQIQKVAVDLFMPYLPGARADHDTGLAPLSVQIYKALTYPARSVTVVDPHSEASVGQMGGSNLKVLRQEPIMRSSLFDSYDYIVCPDKGARDRANEAAITMLGGFIDINWSTGQPRQEHKGVLYCGKERDPATGHLSKFTVPTKTRTIPGGSRLLVVDDICDGGGTFIGLKQALDADNDDLCVDLFVTHGIFSKGLDPLWQAGFNDIITTDSWYRGYDPSVTTIQLLPFYFGGSTK